MNKKTPIDILTSLGYCAVGLGVMLTLMYFLGELHGVILTVVLFIVQTGFLYMRVGMLERQLRETYQARSEQGAPS
jgi:hypothetical protein